MNQKQCFILLATQDIVICKAKNTHLLCKKIVICKAKNTNKTSLSNVTHSTKETSLSNVTHTTKETSFPDPDPDYESYSSR